MEQIGLHSNQPSGQKQSKRDSEDVSVDNEGFLVSETEIIEKQFDVTENKEYQTEVTKLMQHGPVIDESMVYKDMISQIEEIEMSDDQLDEHEPREVLRISVELGDETKIIRVLEG